MYFYNRKYFYIILDKQNYKNGKGRKKGRSEGVKERGGRLKIDRREKEEGKKSGRKKGKEEKREE